MKDAAIRQYVLDELDFDPSINAAQIGVSADNGVVTLTGHVSTYAEKAAAKQAAQRIKGVRAIADEIEVRFLGDKQTADDQIAKRAADILEWDTSVPNTQIQISVAKGWITLSGNVEWQFQRKTAEDDIRKLSGVRGVINNISITPAVQPRDVKQRIESALKRHAEIEAGAIRVTVKDGNKVVIEGTVHDWDERQAVESAAWAAPGVTAVEDHLTIT